LRGNALCFVGNSGVNTVFLLRITHTIPLMQPTINLKVSHSSSAHKLVRGERLGYQEVYFLRMLGVATSVREDSAWLRRSCDDMTLPQSDAQLFAGSYFTDFVLFCSRRQNRFCLIETSRTIVYSYPFIIG
jgi:hypothetical protein